MANDTEKNEFRIRFGKRLVKLRSDGEHKKTRSEVANGLDVSIPTLMSWEKGDSEPSAFNIAKLCKYYNVSSDELLELSKKSNEAEITEQTEQPAEPEQTVQPPSEPESTSPVEQAVQPSEPEPPSQPEQPTQPSMPMCKDCPLMSTVQSLSSAVALALSRR